MKTCSKCGETKPATTEFFSRRRNKLTTECKACKAEYDHEYQAKNKEHLAKKAREWRQKNKEHIAERECKYQTKNKERLAEYARKYQAKNKERLAEYSRKWYQKNKERLAEYGREYYQKNKEHHAEYGREWRQKNKDKFVELNREYRHNNKEKGRINTSNYRARKRNQPDTFTEAQWIACLDYFNYCCAVCGNQLRDLFGETVPHADHWLPISSDDCPGTIATNMVCLCNHCNLSKNAIMPNEWLSRHYSKKEAQQIIERIDNYFASL